MREIHRMVVGVFTMSLVVGLFITVVEGGTLFSGVVVGTAMFGLAFIFAVFYAWMLGGVEFLKELA